MDRKPRVPWYDLPLQTYEVIFKYHPSVPFKASDTPLKGYKVVKARSHDQAKKLGWPVHVWVTSIHSHLVK